MYIVDLYRRVRRAHFVEGMSIREVARVFDLHRSTVNKMLEYSAPPGYQRRQPPHRPKLDPYTAVIDQILQSDQDRPKKQRHTAKRIFQRLKEEHGFGGQYTIVRTTCASAEPLPGRCSCPWCILQGMARPTSERLR